MYIKVVRPQLCESMTDSNIFPNLNKIYCYVKSKNKKTKHFIHL